MKRTSPDDVRVRVRFSTVDLSVSVSQAKRNAPACHENLAAWSGFNSRGNLDAQRSALNC